MTFWLDEIDPTDVRADADFRHPQILFGSKPKTPKLRMRLLVALAKDKGGQVVKTQEEVMDEARRVAAAIDETAPEQRGDLYDAVANVLRVTQNAFSAAMFEALAREERGHDAAPVLSQRAARAMR